MHVCSVLSQVWKSKLKSVFGVLSLLLVMLVLPGITQAQQRAKIRASDGIVYQIEFRNIDPRTNYNVGDLVYKVENFIDDFTIYNETGEIKLCPDIDDSITWELYLAARVLAKIEPEIPVFSTSSLNEDLIQSVINLGYNYISGQGVGIAVDLIIDGTVLKSVTSSKAGAIVGAASIISQLAAMEFKMKRVLIAFTVASRYANVAIFLQNLANQKAPILWDAINAGEVFEIKENSIAITGESVEYSEDITFLDLLRIQLAAQIYQEAAEEAAEMGTVLAENPDAQNVVLDIIGVSSFLDLFESIVDAVETKEDLDVLDDHITSRLNNTHSDNIQQIYDNAQSDLERHDFCNPNIVTQGFPNRIYEGESTTYTLVLKSQPESTATIVISSDNPDITFSPASLTFTNNNWYIPQTVRITAAQDNDTEDDTASTTYTATGYGPSESGVSIFRGHYIRIRDRNVINPPLPEGTIPSQSLTLGDSAITVDVAPYFSSENNLEYDARATPHDIVSDTISGSVITITPEQPGSATVVVTARDTVTGLTAIQTITVLVRQSQATIVRPTNTDQTWRPTTISNPRAEGLRKGVSVIVDGLAPLNNLRVRSGASTNYEILGLVTNGDYGKIISDSREVEDEITREVHTWWEIEWDTQRLNGWSAEAVGGFQLLFRRPPDLEIRDLDVSDSEVSPGEEIELEVKIQNNGPGESDATEVTFYYHSENDPISSIEELGELAKKGNLRGGWRLSVPSIRERRTETLTYRVDAPTVIDSYYYGALLPSNHASDNTDHLDEDALHNNLAHEKPVEVVGAPDYIVESISLSGNRTILDPGDSFTLRTTVRNIGIGEPSSSPTLDYYRSSDARISSSDRWLADDTLSRLDTNETGSESISLIAPTEPGVYYYGACVSDVRNESERSNNCSGAIAITVRSVITPIEVTGSPDLVVSLTSNSNLVDPNEYINLTANIRNQGNADTLNSTTVRYYLSSDAIVSSDDQLLATDSVSSLTQGDSDDENHGVRAPSQPGQYYYYACVDSVTGEDDTGNNCSNFISINVRGSDLVVESVSVDLLGQTGGINPRGAFTLNATIRNQGTGNAGATTVRYYISQDQTFSTVNDSEVQASSMGAINAGASTNAQSTNIRSSNTSGSFYCFVCVDGLSNEINTGNNCSEAIRVTIRNVAPRRQGRIPTQTLNIGTPKSLGISNYFVDDNNDTLTYQASSNDNNIVTASVSGTQVTLTPKKAGSATITVTANDGSLTATQTVSVSVIDPNRAPSAVGTISALTLTAGDAPEEIDVSNKFSDPDNDDLKYTASSNNTIVATASMTEAKLTITPKTVGNATITVTATDGKLTATQTVSVSVVAANRAPTTVGTISAQALIAGGSSVSVNVSDKFSDPDNDTLTYSASSNDDNVATASASGSTVTITPVGTGNATITVAASDGKFFATQTISVSVVDPNRTPVAVGTISARTLTVEDSAIQIDVASNFSDPDNDTLTYSASSNDDNVATTSTSGSTVTITPVGTGSATITVTASDRALTTTQTISVTVTAAAVANSAPFTVGAISSQTLTVGDSAIQIDVVSNFSDPDGDTLTFTANSNNTNVATATVSGSQITITPIAAGSATITVTASDNDLTATQTISVTVTAASVANRAPGTVGSISARTLTVDGSAIQIDVSSNFSDSDDDTLTYTANSNNTNAATATVSGSIVTITPKSAGSATITVTASDSELTATQTISVTVTAASVANRAPVTVGSISGRTLTVGDAAVQIDVASNFSDPDNDTLTYTAGSSNTSVATATVSGSIVTITPKSAGSATITVTASDGELTTTQTISVTVTAAAVANRAPVTVGTIASQTLIAGGTSVVVDVSGNFRDPNNDDLIYSATSNATGIATVSATGSRITIRPVAVGNAIITVIANDGELTATQTISVSVVIGNRAPEAVGTIASQTLIAGGTSVVVDVSGNFRDPNNDDLVYRATSNATSVATVSATGSRITITPISVGSATITVTANDGLFTATQTISVSVTAANRAPVSVGVISNRTFTVGDSSEVVDVSSNFNDPDDDNLTYSANSDNTSVANANASGSQITITPIGVGSATITVTASDAELTTTQTISVTVTAAPIPNRAPVTVGAISNQTMTVGDPAVVLDVSGNFRDPDNDNLVYSASSSATAVATVSVSGSEVTITPVAVGSATITVTASDDVLTATQTISVSVAAPNRAPVAVGTIFSSQTLTAGGSAVVVNVSGNFRDPDNDNLVYSASSSATAVATVSVSGSEVTITPVAVGSATITVTASDDELTATQTISVSVAAPNRAPVAVGTISSQTLTAGGSAVVVNVSGNFRDPDNDNLVYSASSSATAVATVSVSGAQITITPVAAGSATITVTASDDVLTATQTISVSVAAANRAPIAVGTISSQTLTAGSSAVVVNVSGNFRDPDNDDLVYSVSSSATAVATVSVSGSQVTITPVAAGSTTITVTASDDVLTATQTISVSVAAANRTPVAVGTIAAQTLTAGGSAVAVNVSVNFSDPDNDDLTYTVSSSDTSIATVSVSGSQVTITPVAAGSTTITVTASDDVLTATQTISVSVAAPNRAPVAVGTIAAQTLTAGGSAVAVNVSGNFRDPDNDDLVYSASSSATAVATVSVSGSQITIIPVGGGSATITVTANDGKLTATQTFSVSVTPAVSEEIWMPDENLRASVRFRLGLQEGEPLTKQAMATLDSLGLDPSWDRTGLEYAATLTTLTISGYFSPSENQLTDISFLSQFTTLENLNLSNNQISDITVLENLTNLTRLTLQYNPISDITALEGLTSLTYLHILSSCHSEYNISDITALENLTSLTYLNLECQQISDISALDNLNALTALNLGANEISDISALDNLNALTDLTLGSNQISDITPLEDLTQMNVLYLYSNQISDITPLENLTALTKLRLGGNQISDITVLDDLTTLTELEISELGISDITPIKDLTSLTKLWLYDNEISDITPLEDLTALTWLGLWNNEISNVTPLDDLTNLRTLRLEDNEISDVSALEGLTSLETLRLSNNSISDYAPLRRLVAAIEAAGGSLSLDITIPPAAPAISNPTQTSLLPNYPNPFNPETWIPYQLSKPTDVTLTFYNVQGKVVRQLALGHRAAGVYYTRTRAAHWDGKNNLGEKVSTGVYFVKFKAGNYTKTRKMLIRK